MKLFKSTAHNFLNKDFLLIFFGYYFLILFALIWCRGAYIPTHTAESLYLGQELQIGYAKHPPLHAITPYLFWNFFNYSYFSLYFFNAGLLTLGLISSYILSKEFLDRPKAIIATLIYSGVLLINFSQLKINANTILFPLYPMIILFFYKGIKTQKITNWLLFGCFAALGMWGKYSTLVLLFFCGLASIVTPEGRQSYKKPGIYIGILTSIIAFSPHLFWFLHHYKPALEYFSDKASRPDQAYVHLQILAAIFLAITYWLLFVRNWKKPFHKVSLNFETKYILICCVAPIVFILMLPVFNVQIRVNWLSAFFFGIGTTLVYFSDVDLSQSLKIRKGILFIFGLFTTIGFVGMIAIKVSGYDDKYELKRISEYLYTNWQKQFNTNPSYMCHSNNLNAIAAIKLMHDIYDKTGEKHKIHLVLQCDFNSRADINLNDVRAKGLITFTHSDAVIAERIFNKPPVFQQTVYVKKYPKMKSSAEVPVHIKFYA